MEKPNGLIKNTPESFIVQELVGRQSVPVPLHTRTILRGFSGHKPITVFDLVKKGQTTDYAVRQVARQLGVEKSQISMHGMKDRHAHTAQMIGVAGQFVPRFQHDDIVLCQIGEIYKPLGYGRNAGNRFKIQVVTDTTDIDETVLKKFKNYFGHQRFGKYNSYEVGKLILEGKYLEAVKKLLSNKSLSRRLSDLMRYHRSWKKAFFDPSVSFEIGMLVLQWQSHLWNTLLAELVNPPDRLPVWRPEEVDRYCHLWNPVLDKLDSDAVEMIHRFDRPTLVKPKNIKVGRKLMGWEFCFDLPSGAYATMALSQLFNLSENR